MIVKEALELTAPRQRIFVKSVWGRYQRLRWMSFAILLSIFLVTPFLRWGDRPAVLFDVPARRFHFFGFTVWPHEMYLLAGVLLFAALALCFFTTLAGRLWCGYACPQTVYVSLFLEIERLIEGDRPRQQRLASGGWNPRHLAKVAVKHGLYLAVAAGVGFASVAYFIPADRLLAHLAAGRLGGTASFWLLLVSSWLYLDGAFFREQICIYPCPYGRFQGALTDNRSIVVGYDAARGEPRGRAAAGRPAGDCVDCTLCVQSCPQGIDIREGLQGECIGCARCVDACDFVMTRIGRAPGLIRYDSAAHFEGTTPVGARPKLVAYGTLLVLVGVALVAYMAARPDARLDVTRAPGLYQLLPGGQVADLYTVRALNMSDRDREFRVAVDGLPGASLRGPDRVRAGAGEMVPLSVAVVAPLGEGSRGSHPIRFRLLEDGAQVHSRTSRFLGP